MTETGGFKGAGFLPLLAAWMTCAPIPASAAGNIPSDLPSGLAPEATLRVFLKGEPWSLLTEAQASNETDERQYRSVFVGGYYRLIPNLRAGLFYQRQSGVRHDEDWVKDPVTGTWGWIDANGRGENVVFADVSPKFVLGFLPGRNWSLELKARYYYDFFDQEQTIRIRPNLSYFLLRRGAPLMSFFTQAELAFPLNYGNKPMNERWFYLGALYHFGRAVQAGVYGALKWEAWASTAAYTAQTGNTYEAVANSTVLGLLAVFAISPFGRDSQ